MYDYSKLFSKKILVPVFIIMILALIGMLSAFAATTSSNSRLQAKYDTVKEQYDTVKADYEKLVAENSDLQEKIKEAEPWFELSDMEKKAEEDRLAAEKAAKAEAERLAAEKAAAEAEAKEKQGYNTGITYNQLSRTPDDFMGEKVKFKGKVIQVMEGGSDTQLRVAINSNYDTIALVSYTSNIVSSRVLEDDQITLYGVSMGLYTYQSTMGGYITIPLIAVDKIDQ